MQFHFLGMLAPAGQSGDVSSSFGAIRAAILLETAASDLTHRQICLILDIVNDNWVMIDYM